MVDILRRNRILSVAKREHCLHEKLKKNTKTKQKTTTIKIRNRWKCEVCETWSAEIEDKVYN